MRCICCGGEKHDALHEGLDSVYSRQPFAVWRCEGCGHCATVPAPTEAELDNIYRDRYFYEAHRLILSEKEMRARGLAKLVAASFPAGADVIELGCMYGYLLECLRDRGFRVSGLEIGDEAVAHCRAHGLEVIQQSVEEFAAHPPSAFDAIIMAHVFEHLLRPDAVLSQLRDALGPGGLLVLAVPHCRSLNARIFGRYWGWWQVPVHINHFTAESLSRLLERHGYNVEMVAFRGGDSLMLLLNAMNLLGARGGNSRDISPFRRLVIRALSLLLRGWYFLGDEELLIIARRGSG